MRPPASEDTCRWRTGTSRTITTSYPQDTMSGSVARGTTQEFSLGNLTYSIKSELPSCPPDKAQSCDSERRSASPGARRRAFKSEGQLRPILPLPPAVRPAAPPSPLRLSGDEGFGAPRPGPCARHAGQRAQTRFAEPAHKTAEPSDGFSGSLPNPWRCRHAIVYSLESDSGTTGSSSTSTSTSSATSTSGASSSSTAALPQRVVRIGGVQEASAECPQPTIGTGAVERRDVSTCTDTLPIEPRGWGLGGGGLPLAVGGAVLAVLLVTSAVVTAARLERRVTAGADESRLRDAAGLSGTNSVLPKAVPPAPTRLEVPAVRAEETAGEAVGWRRPSTLSDEEEENEGADAELSAERPAVGPGSSGAPTGYGNASGPVTGENPLELPFRRPTKPECGAVFYTYCAEARREFHYRASVDACLAAGEDGVVQLCNRGANRFASWRDCERSCVLAEPPLEACLDRTLFIGCRRQDVRYGWWWFDGRLCVAWSFPGGGCPANGSAVFSTAEQCTGRCTNPRYPPCPAPRSAPCGSAFLKFPFFAADAPSAVHGGSARRCFRLSSRVLSAHRCLIGANRFPSRTACEVACKSAA